MKERPNWVVSGGYSLLFRVFVFIFGFGTYALLTRYFSLEKFGVWALFILVTSLVELARTAFLQNAFIKFHKDPDTDHDALFCSSLLLNFISTVIIVAGLIIAVPFLEKFWHTTDIGVMIYWYCGASFLLVVFTQLNFLEQANHSFKGVFWSNVSRQGVLFLSVAICFLFFPGLSLSFFSFLYFCSTLFGLIVSLSVTGHLLPKTYRVYPGYISKLANFGRFTLGTGATSSIGKYFDQFLLGSISLATVGLYNASVRIINMLEAPILAISNVSYPKLAQVNYRESPNELARLYEKTVAISLAVILPFAAGTLLLPKLVLTITAGRDFAALSQTLQLMTLFFLFMPFNVQFGNLCEVINKPHISFRVNFVANLMNAALNLYFIETYGAQGASWVFCFTMLLIFIVGQWFVKRYVDISIWNIVVQTFGWYRTGFLFVREKIKSRSVNV